jgi:CBS domain-containing protein
MLVRTLLETKDKDVITVGSEAAIDDAMESLISNNIGCLPVIDEKGRLVGILSDKDIFRKIHESKGDYHALKVSDLMNTDLIVGVPDDDLEYIATVMSQNWIRHVPIVEGERLVGLVSSRDIIKTEAKRTAIENRYLRMYMDGLGSRDRSAE